MTLRVASFEGQLTLDCIMCRDLRSVGLRPVTAIAAVFLLSGCPGTLNQVAGTGAIYSTRCSSTMEAKGEAFFARCTPPECTDLFISGPISNVVVAVDPGKKVIGYAERVCYQDLKEASRLFETPSPQDIASQQEDAEVSEEEDERPPPTQ